LNQHNNQQLNQHNNQQLNQQNNQQLNQQQRLEQQQYLEQLQQQNNILNNSVSDEHKNQIELLCDMGYDRKDVEKALRAAYWDPNRAVEYLLSGIPINIENELKQDLMYNQLLNQHLNNQQIGGGNEHANQGGLRMPGSSSNVG